jgi:glycosyltransferase involved in cell wall biosynthesis
MIDSLDVHVLYLPTNNKVWFEQCRKSIDEAVSNAGFEVNVFYLPGVRGDLASARQAGYAKGKSRWKTFIDDDDYVLPEAFRDVGKYLSMEVAAVFPREYVWQNEKLHQGTQGRHHLPIYSSEFLKAVEFCEWRNLIDVAIKEEALRHSSGVLDVDDVVYVHRLYKNSSARVLRRNAVDESDKLRKRYG